MLHILLSVIPIDTIFKEDAYILKAKVIQVYFLET